MAWIHVARGGWMPCMRQDCRRVLGEAGAEVGPLMPWPSGLTYVVTQWVELRCEWWSPIDAHIVRAATSPRLSWRNPLSLKDWELSAVVGWVWDVSEILGIKTYHVVNQTNDSGCQVFRFGEIGGSGRCWKVSNRPQESCSLRARSASGLHAPFSKPASKSMETSPSSGSFWFRTAGMRRPAGP